MLINAVEILREEKADREEVWDGLRDKVSKADTTKLQVKAKRANAMWWPSQGWVLPRLATKAAITIDVF